MIGAGPRLGLGLGHGQTQPIHDPSGVRLHKDGKQSKVRIAVVRRLHYDRVTLWSY